MDGGLSNKSNDVLATPDPRLMLADPSTATLTSIDFGTIKITASEKGWQQVMLPSRLNLKKPTEPQGSAQSLEYLKIAKQWQAILTRPKSQLVSLKNYEVYKTYFVQLYLAKPDSTEQNQPLIVKIEVVSDATQYNLAEKVNPSPQQTLITFVSANLQLVEKASFLATLLPPSVIEGKN